MRQIVVFFLIPAPDTFKEHGYTTVLIICGVDNEKTFYDITPSCRLITNFDKQVNLLLAVNFLTLNGKLKNKEENDVCTANMVCIQLTIIVL